MICPYTWLALKAQLAVCITAHTPSRPDFEMFSTMWIPCTLPLLEHVLCLHSCRDFLVANFLPIAFLIALVFALAYPVPGRFLVNLKAFGVHIVQASKRCVHHAQHVASVLDALSGTGVAGRQIHQAGHAWISMMLVTATRTHKPSARGMPVPGLQGCT